MIRLVVVDDEALVRRGLTLLLRLESDMDVVGEAGNGAAAVVQVGRERPDVVLMDIRMPGMDGLAATRTLMADPATAATRVLILTTFDGDEHVFAALRAGASGFLLKDTPPDELLTAIRVVAGGDALLAPSVTRRLIKEFVRRSSQAPTGQPPGLDLLTERETEVLRCVARGHSNAEIALELFISYATAKTHVSRLLTKLGVRDRAQLVILAYENGIVTPSGV
jgi:DNA-binding NarL/FixJ family response regulator